MKYASEYYGTLNKFSNAPSNMNRLCKDLEKWCKKYRYSGGGRNFDYTIMIDDSIEVDEEKQERINNIFVKFCKEMVSLQHDQTNIRKYGDDALSHYDALNFTINWGYYYDKYKEECLQVCDNIHELANMAVRACYEFYPQKKNTKFMWRVAGAGIVDNIKQQIYDLPIRDEDGEYEYLGKKYSFKKIEGVEEL